MAKREISELLLSSIGVCAANPQNEKLKPCLFVAYLKDSANKASFLAMPMPGKNKYYGPSDILKAIAEAEGAKRAAYRDGDNHDKNIYVCRKESGAVTDFTEYDYDKNEFGEGFAHIAAMRVKFGAPDFTKTPPFYTAASYEILPGELCGEAESYSYAIANAYNACLLGIVFSSQELDLETGNNRAVKIEVRTRAAGHNNDMLYVKPITQGDVPDYYTTEEFNYIDGNDCYVRSYKIQYSNRLESYKLTKQ